MRSSVLLFALAVGSCAPPPLELHNTGTRARITLQENIVSGAELIVLQNEVLYVRTDTLLAIPLAGVRELKLDIDERIGWRVPVILFQGVPSITAIIVGANTDSDEAVQWGAVGLGVTALTYLGFEFSTPRTIYSTPWSEGDIEELNRHARHPYGLTQLQLRQLDERLRVKPQEP